MTNGIPPVALKLNAVSFQPSQSQPKSHVSITLSIGDVNLDLPAAPADERGVYSWGSAQSDGQLAFDICPGMYHIGVQTKLHTPGMFRRSTTESSVVLVELEKLILGSPAMNIAVNDPDIAGMLRIDAQLTTTADMKSSSDMFRTTRIPILEHLRSLIGLLPSLERVLEVAANSECTRAYGSLCAFLSPLWLLWHTELPALLQQHSTKAVERNDALVVSIVAAQDNVLEDTLLQVYRQLSLLVRTLESESSSNATTLSVLRTLIECAATSAILVYQWADTHPSTTWTGMEHLAAKESMTSAKTSRFNNGLANFDYVHTRLVSCAYDLQRIGSFSSLPNLPHNVNDMITFLCRNALEESKARTNMGPYTKVFECLLGPYAEAAYQILEADFCACKSAEDRDSVRRLMTHLVQQSGRLPKSLLLDDVEMYAPNGEAPRPVAGGAFGDVYRGLRGKQLVAIKQLRVPAGVSNFQTRIKQWYLEIMTCRTMDHPNVLPICGIPRNMQGLTLVTPWLQYGTVHEYIELQAPQFADQPVKLLHKLMIDIARGMAYLHSEGLAHGDLRGANILVDENGNARLTDFGLAVFVHGHSKNYASSRTGNLQWQAPEMLTSSGDSMTTRPTFATDVYSFSHVCVELFSGTSPYSELDNGETTATGTFAEAVARDVDPLRPSQPAGMPDVMYRLLQCYWFPRPSARPSATQVVQDMVTLVV